MTEVVTVISAARLIWQMLAKIPWLARCLLRRVFSVSECRDKFLVDMPGSHARFELLMIRPSLALTGLELLVYNPLPFAVEFSPFRLVANINSTGLLDVVLNSKKIIPAAGFARIPMHEISLTEQQANWVQRLHRECTRVQLNLQWRCTSDIHHWEGQGTYECVVYINRDTAV